MLVYNSHKNLFSIVTASLFAICVSLPAQADVTDDIVNQGLKRAKAGAASQKRIDELSEATDKIISQYQQQQKVVEGLKIYNDRLRRTLSAQEDAMAKLTKSIEEASLIERQIVPLMLRMIEGLDSFVKADLPFKRNERIERIERIRSYLTNANISAAERFRQVLNAYQIESDYGKSISMDTQALALGGDNLTVNVLQVGRAGLYYQTLDGKQSGYWDRNSQAWVELDSSYNDGITQSIRITQEKESPNLMDLPISAPEVL